MTFQEFEYKNHKFWLTDKNILGISFAANLLDLETGLNESYLKLNEALVQISKNVKVRLEKSLWDSHDYSLDSKRKSALKELGHQEVALKVSFELNVRSHPFRSLLQNSLKKKTDLQRGCEELLGAFSILERAGVVLRNTSPELSKSQHLIVSERSLESENGSRGLLRIHRLFSKEFRLRDFQEMLGKLPKPFKVQMCFKKMDDVRVKLLLEKKLKQLEADQSIEGGAQGELTEEMLLGQFKEGTKFFEYEFYLEFLRPSKELLTETLLSAKSELKGLEVLIETFGLYPSYLSTQLGSVFHVPVIEKDTVLSAVLPIFGRSEYLGPQFAYRRSLALTRRDQSLWHFDLFNPHYNVFNALLIGTSGKGKSVLLGLLTQSLLHDPDLCIIKLDVGGSHSKECELFGGVEYQMSLDKGSGINPFQVLELKESSHSDKIAILSRFLMSLIQEEGENFIAKSLRSEIEESLREYIESNPLKPNLEDFYKFSKRVPRRELLRRWVKGGVYENAFSGESEVLSSRLRYYNFSKIFQASDPEFAIAGVAAVLAQYNMELLKEDGKKLVLICDEIPFFIKHCFDFFKFSTANLRKIGNAVILTGQISSDFVVDGDTGIIDNSRQRFLFSLDGDEEAYKKLLQLKNEDLKEIRTLRTVSGEYSQCFFKSDGATHKVEVRITPQEYWELTTSKADQEKIAQLMTVVEGLSLREAISYRRRACQVEKDLLRGVHDVS